MYGKFKSQVRTTSCSSQLPSFQTSPFFPLQSLSPASLNPLAREGRLIGCRYNWVVPFGFPVDLTRYHTSWSATRVLRVFNANLARGQKPGQGDIELVFNVPRDICAMEVLVDKVEGEKRRLDTV